MLARDDIRALGIEAKDRLGITWPALAKVIRRSPVYTANNALRL